VPDTICKLTKLQELDLSDNEQLERVNLLSEDGYSLINLVRLDISGCIHMSEIIMSRSTMINNLQTLAAGDGCNARITWVTPERNYSVSVSEIETAQGRLDEHRKTK
jgi:Leucine-rich repeat (LRR) protein